MSEKGIHARVTGMVQGVGFRYYVYRKAEELGLTGFVRNLEAGDVEIFAEGPEGSLAAFLKLVNIGPRGSDVTRVFVEWVDATGGIERFEIR